MIRNQHPKSSGNNKTDARRARAMTYQGEPCKLGHSGIRYTTSSNCVICQRHRSRCAYESDKNLGKFIGELILQLINQHGTNK